MFLDRETTRIKPAIFEHESKQFLIDTNELRTKHTRGELINRMNLDTRKLEV